MNLARILFCICLISTWFSLGAIALAEILLNITVVPKGATVEVQSVEPGRTGAQMGLQKGDVIHQVNGKRVDSVKALQQGLKSDAVAVVWKRTGRFYEAKAYWGTVVQNQPNAVAQVITEPAKDVTDRPEFRGRR